MRTWKIAVLGESTTGDGPLVVSSQLADLEVAEPRLRFQFQPAVVEQGQKTSIVVKIEKTRKLESPATIELLGLPNEVTTEPRQIDDAAGEVIFPIATTSKSPPGLHKTIYCRAVVKSQGEPITHVVGGGELRIQPPLPPKAAVAAKPAPNPRRNRSQAGRRQAAQPPGAIAIGEEGAKAMSKNVASPRPEQTAVASRPAMIVHRMQSSAWSPHLLVRLPRLALSSSHRLAPAATARLDLYPPDIQLRSSLARQQIVVVATRPDGVTEDVTAKAKLTVADGRIARIENGDALSDRQRPDHAAGPIRRSIGRDAAGGAGRGRRPADQLPPGRHAGLHAGRLQHRQLPRFGPRQGRLPPVAVRLRSRGRLLSPHPRVGLSPREPGRARGKPGACRRPWARCRTPAASGSSRRANMPRRCSPGSRPARRTIRPPCRPWKASSSFPARCCWKGPAPSSR